MERHPSDEYDWEEELSDPWNWNNAHEHLDGWKVNHNPTAASKYLMELGREFGPITIPHRIRRISKSNHS